MPRRDGYITPALDAHDNPLVVAVVVLMPLLACLARRIASSRR